MNTNVTIVCCYNDLKQYQNLQTSLEKQNIGYELIGIDNRTQQFTSCSSALNSVLEEIKTEYVIFSHQDIRLPEEDSLKRFLEYLHQIDDGDMLGVAGIVSGLLTGRKRRFAEADGIVLSKVMHGSGGEMAGEMEFTGMTACDTLDECFFGGRTENFRRQPFDEAICDNWHLYGVERCLRARAQGHKVYVCDVALEHYSPGHINHAYNANFRRLAKNYAGQLQKITTLRTVCGSSKTDFWHRNLFYYKRELLLRLGRMG